MIFSSKKNIQGPAPLETRSQQTSVGAVTRTESLTGFSLVEMMTVIAIFFIITAVILANLPDFQNKASMDLIAQDVALSIRSAQVYSSATRRSVDGGFPSYGVNFKTDQQQPEFYLYSGEGGVTVLQDDDSNLENTYTISGRAFISDICDQTCDKSEVNIFFERPKTEAQIFIDGSSVGFATIVLSNSKGDIRYVTVSQNGQIEVSRPEINP